MAEYLLADFLILPRVITECRRRFDLTRGPRLTLQNNESVIGLYVLIIYICTYIRYYGFKTDIEAEQYSDFQGQNLCEKTKYQSFKDD